MKIYGSDGRLIIEVEVDDNSYRNRVIMGDHNITLYFSLAQHVEIPVGAYCDYQNERFTLERPEALKMKHSRHFEYTVRMESYEAKAKIWMFRNPVDGRLKFSLTAKPHEHLQMFVDNMNRRDSGWSVGQCVGGSEVLITYDRVKCYEALGLMAQQLNTEYEFNGKQVSLRKVEYNKSNPLPLSYGRGNGFKPNVGRSNSSDNPPVEILFVQGGDRNIDRSKYGAGELLLPPLQTIGYDGEHFEDESGYNSATARRYVVDDLGLSIRRLGGTLTNSAEDSLDCTDIYPKRVGEVSGVVVVNAEKNFYDIIDESIPSDLDYSACQIEGETMTIVFQSGMLAGREFDVNYFHEPSGTPNTSGYKAGRRFEIVPAEIDGITMPNATFCPSANDTYAVFNCSLPPSYIRDDATKSGASWDMFRAAVRYMFDNEEQKFTFKGELDGLWAKKDWVNIGSRIVLGGYVEFRDDRFQQEGVLVRITGIKDYINNPHSPVIELSNETVSSGFSSELNRLASAEVIISENHRDALNFTKRRFRDAKETMLMLEESMLNGYSESVSPLTVQTMQMLVGDESLQFRFVNNVTNPVTVAHTFTFDTSTKKFSTAGGILQHLTLGIGDLSSAHAVGDYMFWPVSEYESAILTSPTKKYYLYIRADRNKTTHYGHGEANFLLSETPIGMTATADSYHFLVGILNSENGGERSFVTLYGFSEILPGRVTTDRVVSGDGTSYFDLAANAMKLGDLLRFNDQGDGKLVLKGTFVQSTGGEAESPLGCYRGVWNSSYTYYYGDEVTYTTDGYTATYRYISGTSSKGNLPTNTAYWQVMAKGANASRIISVFRVTAVGTTPATPTQAAYPPTLWSKNPPTRSDNRVLWMSQCTISGDGTYGTWSTPVRISGDKGDTGADGTDIEFIYKQSNNLPTASDKPTNEAATDDYVPTGWSDNPNGVSTTYKYEWMCVRTKQSGSNAWSDWSTPVVWSAYGDQGIDGDGFEYVFNRTTTETAPSISDSGTVNGKTKADDDFVPSGWTDDPAGVDANNPYEWVSMRKKHLGTWGSFSTPALWATYSEQGARIVSVYKCVSGTSRPSTPTQSEYPPSGWSINPPTRNNGYTLWMSQCTISGTGSFGNWSTPVRLSGDKGDKGDTGADGTDIEFIYKQSNNLPTGANTPTSVDTDDYVPEGWTDNPQGVSTSYKYEWMSMREKPSGSSSWGDFTPPVVWSAYGEQGLDGDGFEYIFKRYTTEQSNINAPTSENTDGYVPSGWSNNPKGVTSTYKFEYVSTRKKTNKTWGAFTKPALWAKYAKDGLNANYQEYRYAVNGSNTEPPPLDTLSRNPAGWDTAIPAVGALQYLWMTVALINGESDGMIEAWSTPVRHTPIDAIDLGENLVDNSEAKDIIGVLDSNPFQDLSPKNQYAALSKTLCNIPADGTILSCQVRVTLSGCSFKSGGGHIVIYMDGTNAWPIIAEKKNFTANGTYDLMNEGVAYNWYGGTMLNKISARLNNFYEGGTVTIERVKVEVGRRCSAWSLSEADKRGPAITYRGVYNSAKTYEGNRTHIDCVKYGNQYYVARTDAGSFSGAAPTDASKWNPFGATFESVATELLLAENANIAGWIFRNGRLESQRQHDGEPMAYLDGNTGEMRLRGTIQLSTGCEGDISDNNIVFLPKLSSGETRYLSMGVEKEDIGKVVKLFNSSNFGGGRYYIEANTFEVEEGSDFQMTMFGFNYNSIIDPQEIIEMTCFERPSTTQGRKCGQWVLTGRFGTDSFKKADAKGRFARVLAMGKLGGNASTVGISGVMYDGRSLSSAGFTITRTGTGSYTVSFPSGTLTSGYYVFFTGYGANLKGSYMNDTNTGFNVVVSDDSSYNDGEVVFMILDSNWWYSMLA